LDDYGWSDEQAGTVRVPISVAMELYLQHRAQAQSGQKQPAANTSAPTESTPSDSSAGRQGEQKHN